MVNQRVLIINQTENTPVLIPLRILYRDGFTLDQFLQEACGIFSPLLSPFGSVNFLKPHSMSNFLLGSFFQNNDGIAIRDIDHNALNAVAESYAGTDKKEHQTLHKW